MLGALSTAFARGKENDRNKRWNERETNKQHVKKNKNTEQKLVIKQAEPARNNKSFVNQHSSSGDLSAQNMLSHTIMRRL